MAYKEKDTKKWTAQWFETNARGEKKKRRKRGFETKREALEYERQKKLNNSRSMDMKLSEFMEVYFEDKNNPKAEQIEADNRVRAMWNQTVDRALVSGVPEKQILDVKQSKIGQKAKASIQKSGRNPALFKSLIMTAIYALELLISKVFKTALEKADKVTEAVAKSEPDQTKVRAVNESVMAQTELIPEMPKKSEFVSKYPGLADIYSKLEKQNTAIYQRETAQGTSGTGGAIKDTDSQYEAVPIKYRARLWL